MLTGLSELIRAAGDQVGRLLDAAKCMSDRAVLRFFGLAAFLTVLALLAVLLWLNVRNADRREEEADRQHAENAVKIGKLDTLIAGQASTDAQLKDITRRVDRVEWRLDALPPAGPPVRRQAMTPPRAEPAPPPRSGRPAHAPHQSGG